MTLHLNLPGSHHRSSDHQHELREARRLLRERIKDDWEYPTLPVWKSSGKREPSAEDLEDKIAGFRFHTPSSKGSPGAKNVALGLSFDPIEWREREYSDLDASDTETESGPVKESSTSVKSKRSEYKFDGPESVGAQLVERRHARKLRRQVRTQEEMEWNDGLTHWIRRRDIWCSARTVAEVRLHENEGETTAGEAAAEEEEEEEAEADSASASTSSPRASTSSVEAQDGGEDEDENDPETPESSPSTSPDLTASRPPSPPQPLPEVLVPIAPPLLPNHPIRRRINHNMYPEIYSKIILQSRTPSIPINLLTLIKALVQGWKDDGEWPPKNGPEEKSTERKKGSSTKDGIKEKVGRVLRLTGTSEHHTGTTGKSGS